MVDIKVVNGRNYKEEYEKLRRIHVSTNAGVALLEGENRKLREQNNLLMDMSASLTDQLNAQKRVNMSAITDSNETQRKNGGEIKRLREMVKSLGGNPD
jgi:hypothetical protein